MYMPPSSNGEFGNVCRAYSGREILQQITKSPKILGIDLEGKYCWKIFVVCREYLAVVIKGDSCALLVDQLQGNIGLPRIVSKLLLNMEH